MKLKKLTINGLFTYTTESTIEFKDGLVLVNGEVDSNANRSNGAGKSSIIDAICLCLFKTTTRGLTGSDVVNYNMDSGYAILEFSANGVPYRVSFSCNRDTGRMKMTIEQEFEGSWLDLTERSSKGTIEIIQDVIGVDFDTFANSVLFAQNGVSMFIQGKDSERKKLFTEILGLNRIDNALKLAKSKVAAQTVAIDMKNSRITELKSVEDGRFDLKTKLDDAKDRLEKQRGLNEKFNEDIKLLESHSSYTNKLSSLENELAIKESNLLDYKNGFSETVEKSHTDNLSRLSSAVDAHSARIEDIGYCKEELKRLEAEIASIDQAKAVQSDLQEKKRELEQKRAGLMSSLAADESEIAKLKSQYDMLSDESSSCPLCESHLKDPVMVRQKIFDEMQEKKARIADSESDLEDLRRDVACINEQLRDIAEELKDEQKTRDRLARRKSDVESEEQVTNELNELIAEREKAKTDYAKKLDAHTKRLHKLIDERDEAHKAVINLKNEISGMSLPDCTVEDIKERLSWSEEIMQSLYRTIGAFEENLKKCDEAIKSIRKTEKELEVEYETLEHLRFIEKMFGPDGVKAKIIRSVTPNLTAIANGYLARLADGISVEFVTSYEGKSKIVDDFRIMVTKGTHTTDIRSFSGGEKKLLEFAVRFAISDLVRERAESNVGFLILDEPFDGLDHAGIDAVIELLENLNCKFPLIVSMCHIDYAKEKFDQVVTVRKTGEESTIE